MHFVDISALWDMQYKLDGYKKMCRFYAVQLWQLVAEYEIVMRLDDDSMIETPMPKRLEWFVDQPIDYGYVFRHHDGHQPDKAPFAAFLRDGPWDAGALARVGDTHNEYYNNFFIARTAFFLQEDVSNFLAKLDRIFYAPGALHVESRLGDANVHAVLVRLFHARIVELRGFDYNHMSHRKRVPAEDPPHQWEELFNVAPVWR